MVMLKKFCPKCGKDADELYDGLCRDCFMGGQKFVEAPNRISIMLCRCGRSNYKKHWEGNESIDEVLRKAVLAHIDVDSDVHVNIRFDPFFVEGKTIVPVTIVAGKNVDGHNLEKESILEVAIIPQVCDVCSRQSGGYYEAIIQVRGSVFSSKKLMDLVEDKVNFYKYKDTMSFITQKMVRKDGFDVYLGSSSVALKIEQEAKRIYNAETKVTHSLCGMKDGKTLKRLTVLLRASD